MKTRSILPAIILIVLVNFTGTVAQAQTYTKKKEVSRSFKAPSGTAVQITNKYGNINVVPWQKDSVRVEVSMTVQGKQLAKVDKIISSIDFEMLSFGNYINVKTYFRDNQATFWKDVVSYAGQVINTSNDLQIDYIVYMPSDLDLKIDNKFGNVYMDSHSGKADIKIANGDMQGRDFTNTLKLNVEFGSASLQKVTEGDFIINYAELSLTEIGNLSLSSRSSTLDIEKAKSVEISSQRDKLTIKSCSVITGDVSFSRIKIGELGQSVSLNSKYGEFKVNSADKNFRSIRLDSEYTDILIYLDASSGVAVDLTYDAKTRLAIAPQLASGLKKETLNAQLGKVNATGSLGRNASSQLYVNTKAGGLSIFSR